MYHFFVEPSQVHGDQIEILGGDVNHIRNVLRMREGEALLVSDGYGNEYRCRIQDFAECLIQVRVEEKRRVESELSSRITLFQCLPKGDKMELVVQKAVELGVSAVVPVASKRCVVKLDARKEENKRRRWQAIAESAAKQSGRAVIPQVEPVTDFSGALLQAGKLDLCLIPYECAEELLKAECEDQGSSELLSGHITGQSKKSPMEKTREIIRQIKKGQSVGILIGPEGGFEKSEVEAAMKAGAVPVTLGKRILRTETAGLCILSVLMFWLEE